MERAVLNPVHTEPGGGVELWASRALNLAWLPRLDNWHNPSLFVPETIAAVERGMAEIGRRPVWFWRVTETFGAWVVRAIHRAGALKIPLPQAYFDALPAIREAIENRWDDAIRTSRASGRPPPLPDGWSSHPEVSIWDEVERIAARPDPVRLPGIEIVSAAVGLARFGLCPLWEGWEKDAERYDPATVATTATVEAATTATAGAGRGLDLTSRSSRKPSGAATSKPTAGGLF